ncbi:MAG: hypothetical protein H7269_00725 [Cellulomonas sp.]|nr:hypothetical protein [Cellulomonas sp.]
MSKLVTMVGAIGMVLAVGTGSARAEPKISATFSPLHLILPVVEVNVEASVAPKVGVAGILGVGRVSEDNPPLTATVVEGGLQGMYYFFRPFSGLHAGVEAIYLHLGNVDVDSSVTAAGLAAGPFVGWKFLTHIGFTAVVQLGIEFSLVHADGNSGTAKRRDVNPLLNINFGWSF